MWKQIVVLIIIVMREIIGYLIKYINSLSPYES